MEFEKTSHFRPWLVVYKPFDCGGVNTIMIGQHSNIYVKEGLQPDGFSHIVKPLLDEIKNELNRIVAAYYSYQFPEDDSPGIDNVFRIIERTWVGIFNNALIRINPGITTLQEFSVWSSERNIGRCDLLFRHFHNGIKNDFVTEAKVWEFTDNWKFPTPKEFYAGIFGQAYNYYNTERKYYESYNTDVWLLAFVAEWVRNEKMLERARMIMQNWDGKNDPETDFLTLYSGINRGAFVYGKIISIKEYENLYSSANKV